MVEEGGKGTNKKKNGGAWEHRAINIFTREQGTRWETLSFLNDARPMVYP